eukprot:gene4658-5266_t
MSTTLAAIVVSSSSSGDGNSSGEETAVATASVESGWSTLLDSSTLVRTVPSCVGHREWSKMSSSTSEYNLRNPHAHERLSKSCKNLRDSHQTVLEMLDGVDDSYQGRKNRQANSTTEMDCDKNDSEELSGANTSNREGIVSDRADKMDLEFKRTGLLVAKTFDTEIELAVESMGSRCTSSSHATCQELPGGTKAEDVRLDLEGEGVKIEVKAEVDENDVGVKNTDHQDNETKSGGVNLELNLKPNRLSVTSNMSLDVHCRICHCGGDDEKLISPCACAGTLQFIHESCLIQWMKSKMINNCELCQIKIEIVRKTRPIWKWQRPTQRPFALIWVLTFIAALVLNVASVAKDASNHCTSTPCIVFYSIGSFGAIMATVFMLYFARRAKEFIVHWVRINQDWVVCDKASVSVSPTKRLRLLGGPKTQRFLFTTSGVNTMV